MTTSVPRFQGVPTYFRALSAAARTPRRGYSEGYRTVGFHIALHVEEHVPYDVDDNEWQKEVDNLVQLARREDRDGTWSWFTSHFPRCMELVPPNRMQSFVNGQLPSMAD